MRKKLTVGLVWVAVASAQSLVVRGDPTRAAEMQQRVVIEIGQADRERKVLAEYQRREFESRFNQLIAAVTKFTRQYNEGRGSVWPKREADELGKAMRKLQDMLPGAK
jgi:hypothetical protein